MPSVTIQGLKELTDKLAELPKRTEGSIARKALRAGAKIVAAAVSAEAPRDHSQFPRRKVGLLARSIKVRAAKKRKPGRVLFVVRPLPDDQVWWGRLVDRGHRVGKRAAEQKRAAKAHQPFADDRKQVEADPFMERGFDRAEEQAAEAIKAEMAAGIERAMKQ